MEFNEKLHLLRKRAGLTQEELAAAIFVSRTTISKWESGRGYPNIDSLKAIAKFFSVTIDELLSGEEILILAEEDHRKKSRSHQDLLFALFDLSAALLLFLPFFGQETNGIIHSVSLLSLLEIAPYLRLAYFAIPVSLIACGILALALQNCKQMFWLHSKKYLSLILNAAGVLLFIVSPQPYAAVFLFVFLAIKLLMLAKQP